MSARASTWTRRRAGAGGALVLVLSIGAAGCSRESDGPSMTNVGDAAVSVRSADGDLAQIEPDGGVLFLTDDCLPAPLVVTYARGREVTVDAPLCPGQELLIDDGGPRLVERSHD